MYAYVRIPVRVASRVVPKQRCNVLAGSRGANPAHRRPPKRVMRLTPLSSIWPHGLLNHVNVVRKFLS